MEKCMGDVSGWFIAIKKSNLLSIQTLSKYLEDIDVTTTLTIDRLKHENVTGLIYAAYVGDKDIVRWFLSQNANPNATSNLGWRPIHFAAKRGHVATVDMLVQQGAEIDVYTKNDETPLMLAEQSRMWDTVRKLKQLGAIDEDRSDTSPMLSTRENGPVKRRKKNFTTSESKTTCGPICHLDISPKHSSKLIIKHLQYQNHPYDIDLSRKKLEFTSQMLNLPLPFTSRHNSQFYKNLKKLTAANLDHDIRINAAVELIGILKSAASVSKRSGATYTKSNSSRSLESCLRTLEFSVCEKHCSSELLSLIADITSGLIILFDHSEDANVAVITYVGRLIQWMCRNNSSQCRSGVLALIASILSKNPPTTHISPKLAVTLISNLISLTDSLNQVEAVSRLVNIAVLIGDYNPREFGRRFNDLVDILIGWCVDSSDAHHSVSQGSILNQICLNFSKWWFCEASSEVPSFKVSQSTCGMLSHLMEDADNAFREALTEHYQLASVKLGRHSGRSIPHKDTTQRLVAAKLFFSVLAGVCSSMLKYANESTPPGLIDLTSLDQPEWHNRLLSILQTLDMFHSLNSFKPHTSSRSHIPPTYSIPLLIYGEIVRSIHEILLFTNSTVPLEQDYIGLHIESYLILPLGNCIVQPSSQHAKILCELALSHLKSVAKRGHAEVLRAIRIFFKSNTFLQRLKVSKCGSAELVNLLLGLVKDCDLLDPVIDMCLSDFKSVCSKLSSGSFTNFDELCILFAISLFSALWKACFGQPKVESILKKAVSRLRNILTEIHMSENIPLRIRLAFWSLVLQFRDLELSTEVVAIAEELTRTATINLHELILLNHALKMVDSTTDTNISQALSTYLLRLTQNPCSPVRANCGADFCEAVGHLIRLWKDRKPNEAIFKLIYMCLSHPFPRIQSRGADLLLIFGRSLRHLRSPLTKNALLHWYSDTDVFQSTALIANEFMGQRDLESSEEVVLVCGAFPSFSGASGVFNIITRGVPPSENDLTRFSVLEHSNDYLRRLACLISPIPTYSCNANWFAEDTSPLSIISHFASSAIMDNKLNVAPWTDPISTFLSIEGIIHAVLANLTGRIKDYPYAKDLKAFFDIPVDLLSYQTPSWLLNHGGKLLTFMRSIEKSMMNGIDGYAAAMLPSPISTHIFLRANAVTCRKWFNRIRIPLASLADWMSGVSLQGVECPATVVWNIYSILYQTISTNPHDFLNKHKFVDNPEKIMLLLIQALHQLKAVDELELVHHFLERLPLNATTSGLHIFSWIRGLVQILRRNLDEGITFLFHFFEVFSTPLSNSFGAMSYQFAWRTFTHLLLRIGGCMETQSDNKKVDVVDNQGDAPPVTSRRRALFKKDLEVSERFLFRQPDVARCRIKALEKLSSWDNSMPEISKPAEALASFVTDQEDRLLSRAPNFLSEVTLITRNHASAVIPLIDLANCAPESSVSSLHLDAESTLQTLAAEADLLVTKSLTPWPPIVDLDLGTWSLLTKKDISPSVFLDACEPLLLPPNDDINRLPVAHSRGVALRLLNQQFSAMGIKEDLHDFANLIVSIKLREDLGRDDKLRFIRYVANLLWTASDAHTNRIAAMKCLSEGLLYSITSESAIKTEKEDHCQLNVSVALQLFECLSYPSSSQTSSAEIRNLCHEVVDLLANEQASILIVIQGKGKFLLISMNCQIVSSVASDLVKDLRIFGQMASNTWADGKPIRSSLSLDPIENDLSPSELQMRLLMFATNISHTNESASAWLEMAHWCYERGQSEVKHTKTESKRVLEASSSEYISTSILNSLTMEERGSLIDLIPPEVFKEVPLMDKRIVAKIYLFLDKISDDSRSCRYCVEDIQNPDATASGELMDTFMEYLTEETSLIDGAMTFNSRLLSECSSLAATLTTRLHTLQSISAQAYVTFLAVAGRKFVAGGSSQEKIRPLNSTRAALRLLSLLNEPSRALRNTVADLIIHGITKNSNSFISDSVDSHTGSIVWTECLPQILDRLGHPDPVVRRCLLDLLNRLIHATTKEAIATSNSDRVLAKKLVYPALVGCRGIDYVKVEAKVESHLKLVEALVDAGYSTMVNEVSSLIDEMRRITVLWDELWFGILTQHLDDFDKRLIALEQKTEGEKENLVNSVDDILKLRCEALLAPTFSVFEQLCALTLDASAETPHELWFQNTYREHIDNTLQILRNFCTTQPLDNCRKLLEPIKNLYKRFQMLNQLPVKKTKGEDQIKVGRDNQENENGEVEEGSREDLEGEEEEEEKEERKVVRMIISNRLLDLAEISPILLTMNCNSSIPLPGRARTNLVHIAPEIRVYPTKTRPKYLTFLNDRGQAMPYLLKCLEDLRLDERIMGLLRLTNTAFSLDGQPNAYTTPTYSITPIGPKAGLIQMVQAAVPLFKLYKKWQQRIALDMAIDKVGDRPLEFIAKAKPSELFYRKLREHLPAHLANLNSRHLWSKEVLVKILNELEMQIPQDLMTRELWAASSSMSAWWRIHRTYATSLGVTSAFGYLIGLGDRHLDNLLVDLSTGRIVHIDFNVCFDEGRSLKVPELVPFRFTRILRHALGPFSMCNASKVGGTFGASFVKTLRTCRSIQELFHMHLQSFEIDPLNNWMSAIQSGVSWSAFDLAYFAAFRGGCLLPLTSGSQDQMTKKRRVRGRLNVEMERTIGLMAARMAELGIREPSWQTEVNSLLNILADNLNVLKDYQEKQTEIDLITHQLAILCSKSEGFKQLVTFEHHCHEVENAKEGIKSALKRVESFVTDLEANIDRDLDILNDWLNQSSPSSSGDLPHLLDEYRNFAQICMLSSDSKLHFSRDNTIRFANKREVASALKQAIRAPNVLTAFKELYHQTVTPQVDNFFSTSLHNALTDSESNLRALREQHFIPSVFDCNGLRSLFDQSHESLMRFIHQNNCHNIQAAYSLSLVRNLITWITSMFVMEPLVHIDVLYQHTGAIECSISVLDPTGSGNGLPFWAGNEIDTNSELQFFSIVHALIGKVVELRDSLCFGFLPSMESAIRRASRSDLLLLDRIQEVINSTDSALQLQQAMNAVVMGDPNSPLAEVFKQIHVTLLTVAIELENTCQSLANYPINATSWSRVDWITQAIAPLQSRCTADVGATSLWGWRPSNGPCELTTWLDEVYRAGMMTILKVATEISSIWTDVREGRQHSVLSSVPYITVLERDFINSLSDRLVLVSEALLASSRVLLALFESLGISVQQELLQQQNLMPVMGVASTVSVLRLHQMAETYAGIDPNVLMLTSAIDSQLVDVFNATNSYVYTLLVSREIEANEVQLSLLRSACQTFDWMHDYADYSDSSLRSYLKRLKSCVGNEMKAGENADPEIKSLCEIGLAICAAEHSRLGDNDDLDNAVVLLTDYTSFCRKLGQCEKEFTETDTVLFGLKNQFNLSWPATEWPNMEWVTGKLSSRIKEIKQELQTYENGIDSAISTLVEENLVRTSKNDSDCLSRALLSFEKKFLTELSPYVKQLERFSKISSDQECESIWKQWLENCETWKTTSSQIVKDLTELTSGYSLKNRNKIMITGFLSVLRNCLQLRDHLGPSFKMLLEKGILKVLKRSKSNATISIIEKLGLVDNVKVEDYSEVSDFRAFPQEVVSPQALIAMRRLFNRLQGVDEYLMLQNDEGSSSTVLSFTEQAHLCIRAAMDPNNLALMFEGWTPWV